MLQNYHILWLLMTQWGTNCYFNGHSSKSFHEIFMNDSTVMTNMSTLRCQINESTRLHFLIFPHTVCFFSTLSTWLGNFPSHSFIRHYFLEFHLHTGRNCFNLFQISISANTADTDPGVSRVSKVQKFCEKFKNTNCQVDHPAKIE